MAYTYTTGSLTDLSPTVVLYTYEGDRLTAIGSTAITYDALGNPLTYGTATYTWQNGRQLATVTKDSTSVSYEYNDSGIRTSKTVNGVKHTYTLNGSQIVTESWTQSGVEYFIVYLYDESGAPIGMQYRTSNYAWAEFDNFYFEKNLFGDIVAIYNEAGTKIGYYKYDAWGACTATTYLTSTTAERNVVTNLNPFRYRGYYYDTETGFYYLQSRYYNPQWGRFLNADGYISTGTGLLGFNMYAYCNNNPIMFTDAAGENPLTGWLEELFCDAVFAIYDFLDPGNETSVIQVGHITTAGAGGCVTISKGIAIDREGNFHNTFSIGGGGMTTVALSAGLFFATSNTPTTYNYQGGSFSLGGSAGPTIKGVSISAGYDYSISLEGAYYTNSISLSAGVGLLPAEFHSGISHTWVWNCMDWITGESNNTSSVGYRGGR